MAMLEGVADLDLQQRNTVTQAWVEQEYHHARHAEIGTTPLRRFLDRPGVGRECPDSATLRRAFRCTVQRRQRRSDGTFSLAGEQPIALLGFGATAWQTAPRDCYIGWSHDQRRQNLQFIVNNARFLTLPWVQSKNLASMQESRRLSPGWPEPGTPSRQLLGCRH